MFSIENLLSKNYSSKSSLRGTCRDLADENSQKDSYETKNRKVTEVNGLSGKRDILFVGLVPGKDSSSAAIEERMVPEGDEKERQAMREKGEVTKLSRKRKSEGESCGESDLERDSESEEGMKSVAECILCYYCM